MAYETEFMKNFHGKECLICETDIGTHGSHVKSKGSMGACIPENVYCSCYIHHREFEFLGINGMAKKYKVFNAWLEFNKWQINDNGTWFNKKVEQLISNIEKGFKWNH